MKKTIVFALALLCAISGFAKDEIDSGYRLYGYAHINGTFSASEDLRYNPFGKSLSWGFDFGLGYNFNDFWGAEFDFAYNKNKGAAQLWDNIWENKNIYSFNSIDLTPSMTFNLSNAFTGFTENRKNNVYIHVGPTIAIRSKIDVPSDLRVEHPESSAILGGRIGFNYIYNFNNNVAFTADVSGSIFDDKFSGNVWQEPLDGRFNIGLGVRVYLTRSNKPSHVVEYVDKINIIHDTITVKEQVMVNSQDVYPIFFDANSSKLHHDAMPVVKNLVEALKASPTKVVYVLGYADKSVERDENATLAKDRADIITYELIKAGIDKSRIVTHDMGDKVQPYLNMSSKNRSTICIITDLKDE